MGPTIPWIPLPPTVVHRENKKEKKSPNSILFPSRTRLLLELSDPCSTSPKSAQSPPPLHPPSPHPQPPPSPMDDPPSPMDETSDWERRRWRTQRHWRQIHERRRRLQNQALARQNRAMTRRRGGHEAAMRRAIAALAWLPEEDAGSSAEA